VIIDLRVIALCFLFKLMERHETMANPSNED